VNWNLAHYRRQKAAQIVAVCDVDERRLCSGRSRPWTSTTGTRIAFHAGFPGGARAPDIDAVMISTPDHWHTIDQSCWRCQAGKDVQCEKPTLTIDEGKVLMDAVRKTKRVFQTSTEDRSVPEYHRMAELVRNGRIGKLQRSRSFCRSSPPFPAIRRRSRCRPGLDWEMWLGTRAVRAVHEGPGALQLPVDRDYSGGIICDWGTHLFDTAQWANDTERSGPVEIEGTGTHWEGGSTTR
jgi:predicted dehydrogenase